LIISRGWPRPKDRALAPKRLVTIRGGHFDAYVADFEAASQAAVEWFTQHLA
jgi:uncharacterized protein